jgi:hypothetical protein
MAKNDTPLSDCALPPEDPAGEYYAIELLPWSKDHVSN